MYTEPLVDSLFIRQNVHIYVYALYAIDGIQVICLYLSQFVRLRTVYCTPFSSLYVVFLDTMPHTSTPSERRMNGACVKRFHSFDQNE